MLSFSYADSDMRHWYIIWNAKTWNRKMNLKNVLCTMPLWVGISWKACLFFCLDYKFLLGLPKYWSDFWKRYNLEGVHWCVDWGLTWWVSLAWGQVNRLRVGGNFCMLPCHSCYIYGSWGSQEVEEFKVIVWREAEEGQPQSQEMWENFHGGVDPSTIL